MVCIVLFPTSLPMGNVTAHWKSMLNIIKYKHTYWRYIRWLYPDRSNISTYQENLLQTRWRFVKETPILQLLKTMYWLVDHIFYTDVFSNQGAKRDKLCKKHIYIVLKILLYFSIIFASSSESSTNEPSGSQKWHTTSSMCRYVQHVIDLSHFAVCAWCASC